MDGEDMTVKARMLKLLEQNENELISGEVAAAVAIQYGLKHLALIQECKIPSAEPIFMDFAL